MEDSGSVGTPLCQAVTKYYPAPVGLPWRPSERYLVPHGSNEVRFSTPIFMGLDDRKPAKIEGWDNVQSFII